MYATHRRILLLLLGVVCALSILSPRLAHAQFVCSDPVHYTSSTLFVPSAPYIYLDPRDPVNYILYGPDQVFVNGYASVPVYVYIPPDADQIELSPFGEAFGISVFVAFCELAPTPTLAPSPATAPRPVVISADPLASMFPLLAVLLGFIAAFALLIQIRR